MLQSRQMSFKHITVRYQKHKVCAALCGLNYRSHGIEIFSDLWSSLIVFDNISENKITLTKVVSLELKIVAPKPEMCEMDGNFRLQNGLSKKAHKMILTWWLRRFSNFVVICEICIFFFFGLRKIPSFRKSRLFQSCGPHYLHLH